MKKKMYTGDWHEWPDGTYRSDGTYQESLDWTFVKQGDKLFLVLDMKKLTFEDCSTWGHVGFKYTRLESK